MAIILKLEGLTGNASLSGYEDWIKIDSFNFGIHQAAIMDTGNMGNRTDGQPQLSRFTINRETDETSVGLMRAVLTQKVLKVGLIEVTETNSEDSGEARSYLKYELAEIIVDSYDISGDSSGIPQETVSFTFTNVKVAYEPKDAGNKALAPIRLNYSVAGAKSV